MLRKNGFITRAPPYTTHTLEARWKLITHLFENMPGKYFLPLSKTWTEFYYGNYRRPIHSNNRYDGNRCRFVLCSKIQFGNDLNSQIQRNFSLSAWNGPQCSSKLFLFVSPNTDSASELCDVTFVTSSDRQPAHHRCTLPAPLWSISGPCSIITCFRLSAREPCFLIQDCQSALWLRINNTFIQMRVCSGVCCFESPHPIRPY